MTHKKSLAVSALQRGTVIDHIPAKATFEVVKLLDLSQADTAVTIGNNLPSARLGLKGIIKVAQRIFSPEELGRIAIVAPTAVVNVIEDYEVVKKTPITLPDEITGLVKCTNPKCITCHEPMKTRFSVVLREPVVLRCRYCEHEYTGKGIELL